MTLPLDDIKTAVHGWLVDSTELAGDKVIWAYQNAPEPTGLFIKINPLQSVGKISVFDELVPESDGTQTVLHYRNITCSVQAFGPGASATLAAALDGLDHPFIYQTNFAENGISARSTTIRDLSQIKGTRYEERAQIDLFLYSADTTSDEDSGWFDTVEYSSDADQLNLDTHTVG